VLNSKNNEAMTTSEIFDVGVEKDWYKETNPWVTSVQRVIDCLRRSNKFEMDDGKYRMSFIGVERAKEVCEDFDATKLISTGRAKRKRSFKYDDMDLSDEEIRPQKKKRRMTKKTLVAKEGELLKKKRRITHVAIKKEPVPISTETHYDLTIDSEDESVGEVLPDADSKPDEIIIQEEDHMGQGSEDLPPPISPVLDSEMKVDVQQTMIKMISLVDLTYSTRYFKIMNPCSKIQTLLVRTLVKTIENLVQTKVHHH
jgi:hypothetical protein